MRRSNLAAQLRISSDPSSWTSHTVVVVDQSGSMRKDDVADGITRSDAVWLTLAMDFVHRQLVSGEAKDTDVVSVVGMNTDSTLLVDRQPMDWVLFNKLVDLLRTSEPKSEGRYVPALQTAEKLLLSNTTGSCALLLLFLSDGKPSDHVSAGVRTTPGLTRSETTRAHHIDVTSERIKAIASRFGRRLSVHTVGFAGTGEDFSVLRSMSSSTAEFGSLSGFQAPSMTAESLGFAIASITSTLTSTKTELTLIGGTKQRTVRDVLRESRNSGTSDTHLSSDWMHYPGQVTTTDGKKRDCVRRFEFSIARNNWCWAPAISNSAKGVAMHKRIFGEGAERMVSRFREVDIEGRFVAPHLVAKESRFFEDIEESFKDQKKFHEIFCRTQIKAQDLARVFNERLAQIPGVTSSTPRLEFLDCCVIEIDLPGSKPFGILVQEMIDNRRYRKYNSNNGYVHGQKKNEAEIEQPEEPAAEAKFEPVVNLDYLDQIAEPLLGLGPLGALIEEDSEEEGEDDEDADHEDKDHEEQRADTLSIQASDIPQAFSHFTYRYTKRKMMVCDLQGVLEESLAPPMYRLTDPVIHYSSKKRANVFGRTDRGRKGMQNFLKTHKCSELCRTLNRRWFHRKTDSKPTDPPPKPRGSVQGVPAPVKVAVASN